MLQRRGGYRAAKMSALSRCLADEALRRDEEPAEEDWLYERMARKMLVISAAV